MILDINAIGRECNLARECFRISVFRMRTNCERFLRVELNKIVFRILVQNSPSFV